MIFLRLLGLPNEIIKNSFFAYIILLNNLVWILFFLILKCIIYDFLFQQSGERWLKNFRLWYLRTYRNIIISSSLFWL